MDPVEFGKLVATVESLSDNVATLSGEVAELKGSMNKGWGVIIGAAAVLGLFATELINGIKHLIGIGSANG